MSPTTLPVAFQQRLDQSAITRPMVRLWLLAASLIALDGFDFFIIGVALPFLQRDLGLGPAAVGAVAAAAVAGSLLGSLFLGPLTDKLGRQPMLIADVILFVVATAGTALAWNLASLLVFRVLVGVAIGADYPISVAYIVENVPTRHRDQLVIGAFSFQAVGALLGALVGIAILYGFSVGYPGDEQMAIHYAWRWMLGVGVVLALGVALARLAVSLESPAYLLSQGDYEAASAMASELLEEPMTLKPDGPEGPIFAPDDQPQLRYRDLFVPTYRRQTLLASVPWFLQDIATYGVGIFTPVILGVLVFGGSSNLVAQTMASAKGSALVDIFLILGFLLAVLLVKRLGPIVLQIVGFLGMALGLGLLAASTGLPAESRAAMGLIFGGFLLFNLLMNAGPNATTFLLSGAVFPAAIRASGAGLSAAIAKAGAVLGTFGLPVLQQALGLALTLVLLALLCGLAAVVTFVYRREAAQLRLLGDGSDGAIADSPPT
ncbi:MFS transporter [Phormidium tenue]|uniref:MFS transporter n=1 Tax=Phormidium tenue NIES-30 TaxID=549789 RepID=A0A1U7J0M3_9CYAN|nr:MFS transporter [Phormidium tenue]MBD2234223.1 MFS transporter [Phormidium tenue FACHB-1052]OKH45158.1 MFS transporter [Phormidium tenue NIES-30]